MFSLQTGDANKAECNFAIIDAVVFDFVHGIDIVNIIVMRAWKQQKDWA